MDLALLVALAATAALLLVLLCVTFAVMLRDRRRLVDALDAARTETESLRARLDTLSQPSAAAHRTAGPVVPDEGYVITRPATDEEYLGQVSNRLVLSAALGEPLAKAMAFGYALRRVLSPANRNRIAFEMRREVKRARKQRRRDARQARRDAAAAQRERLAEDAA
jgi:hypothetical protein